MVLIACVDVYSFNPFATESTLLCSWKFEHANRGDISSRFSSNFVANASELLENLEEMSHRYWSIVWNLSSKYPVIRSPLSFRTSFTSVGEGGSIVPRDIFLTYCHMINAIPDIAKKYCLHLIIYFLGLLKPLNSNHILHPYSYLFMNDNY